MRDPTHGVKHLLGAEAVLSRWHVAGCANCQNHLDVRAHIPLPVGWTKDDVEKAGVYVKVHTREMPKGSDHKKMVGGKLGFEYKGVPS
jgi:tyrosinase